MVESFTIASSHEVGSLGVMHLKRIWSSALAMRQGQSVNRHHEELLDRAVLNCLGVGLHQTLEHLFANTPTFEAFENWIITTAGKPNPLSIERINATIAQTPHTQSVRDWLNAIENSEPVLTPDDLSCWQRHGYVILKNAVSIEASQAAADAIWQHIGADPDNPDSWYTTVAHGIMVELIQHPAFERNRCSARIQKAFSQLWSTADLWMTADRCGFHPPQKIDWPFPGPDLHWDIDFAKPQQFSTQGILYLTDTPPEQGALTVVPGFQHRLADWLKTLPPNAVPHHQDLHALGSLPIGGQAGDMVIWHHALPHGSRPNLGSKPRIVQYINMLPGRY